MILDIQLRGDKELLAALDQVKTNVAKKVLGKSLKTAAGVEADYYRGNAPVKSGLTRGSIRVRPTKRSRVRLGYVVRVSADLATSLFGKGGSFYAGFVNFGWHMGRRRRRQQRLGPGYTEAQQPLETRKAIPGTHWMEKASDDADSTMRQVFGDTLARGIEDEVNKSPALKR